jgi:hypothetical protein
MGGINGALIAYGQTGSGKTYTMFGPTHDGRPALNSPQVLSATYILEDGSVRC